MVTGLFQDEKLTDWLHIYTRMYLNVKLLALSVTILRRNKAGSGILVKYS
jgi:hypothetical protein